MPTLTLDSHTWVPPSTPADISDVETYITDLNAVPMEDRDYSVDEGDFEHFFGEKSLDYYDTMANTDWFDKKEDLEHVLDNVLGIGWENMDNQHTKQLREAMDDMDADGSGEVDLEEFQEWFGRGKEIDAVVTELNLSSVLQSISKPGAFVL